MGLIIRYWKQLLVLILLVLAFSYAGVQGCKQKKAVAEVKELKTELKVEKSNTAHLRAFIIDSVQTNNYEQDIAKLDSVKAVEAQKTKVAEYAANYHANEANRLRAVNAKIKVKLDSLLLSDATCPEMLSASIQAIDSLRIENNRLDSANIELDIEAEGYSRQLYIAEQQRDMADSVILSKKRYITVLEQNVSDLQCYREWGNGHRFLKWLFGWKCGR